VAHFQPRSSQRLGDPEVEQLGPAAGIDQNVPRFQVAVNHEVPIRFRDRLADMLEQLDPRAKREPTAIAVVRDRQAVDVLHDEVEAAVLAAGVEQLGDVWVVQRSENAALLFEARDQIIGLIGRIDDFDRDLAAEGAVGSSSQIHPAHATRANHSHDFVRREAVPDERVGDARRFDGLYTRVSHEQTTDFFEQRDVVAALVLQELVSGLWVVLQRAMEQLTNAIGRVAAHGWLEDVGARHGVYHSARPRLAGLTAPTRRTR
jgi:hypothetical protein